MKPLFRYWLPVLAWMAIIFSASTDMGASPGTSRIIGPILHWLLPDLSKEATGQIVFLIRKTAHVTEYGILALLLWRALRKPAQGETRTWEWPVAGWAWALAACYAATDEFHQSFVPSRTGALADVLLDSAGAGFALCLWWLLGRWRKYW